MKINVTKLLQDHENETIEHVLIDAISRATKKEFNTIISQKDANNGFLDIKLTVEGIEVPFDKTMVHYQRQLDDMVKRMAEELINDKAYRLFEDVENLNKAFTKAVYDRLGIKSDEDN